MSFVRGKGMFGASYCDNNEGFPLPPPHHFAFSDTECHLLFISQNILNILLCSRQ